MTLDPRTFAFGTLEENGDTFLLITQNRLILLDINLSDLTLEHTTVSVIGHMGIPPSSGMLKLIVEKLASHIDIAQRAYEIFESGRGGSADENWIQAERQLLGM